MSDVLAGRTALVTGASRGIGAAVAVALGRSGARVALLARTRPALEEVAARLGNGAFPVECDLTSEASLDRAAAIVQSEIGHAPDIVVNNAGLFRVALIEATAPAEFDGMLRANLFAPFLVMHAFLPGMRARGAGHFVTIGSIGDRATFAGNSGYSATKFGARALHQVLREETRGSGIRATLVSPAQVDTDLWDSIRFPGSDAPPDRRLMLDPAAVADAVLFAVTQPASVNVDELRLARA